MAKRDYYEALGVEPTDDDATIKKAYRRLAMQYHPDRNPDDSEAVERMKEINEAYAVLSDAQKRRIYDTYGHAGLEGYTQEDLFRGVDFGSLFREFGMGDLFGFGGGLFETLFGAGATSRRARRKGADLRYDLSVTLEDVAFGAEKRIEFPMVHACPTCNGAGAEPGGLEGCDTCRGTGQLVQEQRSTFGMFRQISVCPRCRGQGQRIKEACRQCEGRGQIQETREVVINVPPGADAGQAVRVDGYGEPGPNLAGDLYVVLHVEPHPRFQRQGDDLYAEQKISFTTAALGGRVQVPTLDGEASLDLPPGTQPGTTFRLPRQGIPHLEGRGRGDLYAVVNLQVPTDLSPREQELLQELAQIEAARHQDDGASRQPH